MSGELVVFLRARLDEDEAVAQTWAEHDLRGLREVAAKQAIVDAFVANDSDVKLHFGPYPREHGQWDGLRLAVRYVAAIYRDHPDYQEEWRP